MSRAKQKKSPRDALGVHRFAGKQQRKVLKNKGAATAPMKAALRAAAKPPHEALGLKLVPAATGSHHEVLVTKDGSEPNEQQRVAMAKRIQEQKNVGAYIPQAARQAAMPPTQPESEEDMSKRGKPSGIPGLTVEQVTKDHRANAKEYEAAQAAKEKAAAAKAKEEAAAAKKTAKGRKALKVDVTPKTPKFTAPIAALGKKGAEPRPATHAVSVPAAKAKAGRPRGGFPEGTKFYVADDPTKSGMSKVFLETAKRLKKFTKAELVAASKKALADEVRAGRFFDYFVSKKAFVPVK